jgi:hypothetical protein
MRHDYLVAYRHEKEHECELRRQLRVKCKKWIAFCALQTAFERFKEKLQGLRAVKEWEFRVYCAKYVLRRIVRISKKKLSLIQNVRFYVRDCSQIYV